MKYYGYKTLIAVFLGTTLLLGSSCKDDELIMSGGAGTPDQKQDEKDTAKDTKVKLSPNDNAWEMMAEPIACPFSIPTDLLEAEPDFVSFSGEFVLLGIQYYKSKTARETGETQQIYHVRTLSNPGTLSATDDFIQLEFYTNANLDEEDFLNNYFVKISQIPLRMYVGDKRPQIMTNGIYILKQTALKELQIVDSSTNGSITHLGKRYRAEFDFYMSQIVKKEYKNPYSGPPSTADTNLRGDITRNIFYGVKAIEEIRKNAKPGTKPEMTLNWYIEKKAPNSSEFYELKKYTFITSKQN